MITGRQVEVVQRGRLVVAIMVRQVSDTVAAVRTKVLEQDEELRSVGGRKILTASARVQQDGGMWLGDAHVKSSSYPAIGIGERTLFIRGLSRDDDRKTTVQYVPWGGQYTRMRKELVKVLGWIVWAINGRKMQYEEVSELEEGVWAIYGGGKWK